MCNNCLLDSTLRVVQKYQRNYLKKVIILKNMGLDTTLILFRDQFYVGIYNDVLFS